VRYVNRVIGMSVILLLMAIFLVLECTSCGKGQSRVDNLIQSIASGNEKERTAAYDELRHSRAKMIQDLIAIVNQPVVQGEQYANTTTPRNLAIYLLGNMRAPEAVPHLVNWLAPHPQQDTTWFTDVAPAVVALAQIGKPAVPHLLKLISITPKGEARDRAIWLIKNIEGEECGKIILKKAIEQEKDPEKKANLEKVLSSLKKINEQIGENKGEGE